MSSSVGSSGSTHQVSGGLTWRKAPASGLRPSVRFAIAVRTDARLGWVQRLGVRDLARRARGRDRPRHGVGDPDLPRLHPRSDHLVHDLHAPDHALRGASARSSQGRLGRRRVAAGDDPGGGVERERRRSSARSNTSAPSRTPVVWKSWSPTTTRPTTPPLLADAAGARLPFPYRRVFEERQGKHHALNAALGDGDDTARGDGRCRHPPAAAVAHATRRSRDAHAAGPARLRLRRRPRRREPAGDVRHPDAAVGLPTRDQRRQAHAGGLQHRARRPGRVLGLLDE